MGRRAHVTKTAYPGVKKAGKGEYQIRGHFVHPKTGRRRELVRIVRATSARAASEARAEALRNAGAAVDRSRVRFEDFARSWLSGKRPNLKASTQTAYASAIDLHLTPTFGDWFVDAIAFEDVIAWRDGQAGSAIDRKSVV